MDSAKQRIRKYKKIAKMTTGVTHCRAAPFASAEQLADEVDASLALLSVVSAVVPTQPESNWNPNQNPLDSG